MDCSNYLRTLIFLITSSIALLPLVSMETGEHMESYDGDQVVVIDVPDPESWSKVTDYFRNLKSKDFDIWKMPSGEEGAHVFVKKHLVSDIEKALNKNDLSSRVLIHDVGSVMRQQKSPANGTRRHKRHTSNINRYYARYDEILDWMDSVAQQFPDVASVLTLGKTHEGRDMRALKLGIPRDRKWGVWIDAGVHAREWISSSTVIFLAQKMLEGYARRDAVVTSYLEQLDWYLLPVMNPDGYEYTHTKNRLWRKNRRPSSNPNCTGVDLNRNFGYMWGGADSNSEPCHRIYRGERPESELEVRHVVDFISPRADSLIAYLSYHSYGHKLLAPWSYTDTEVPPDHQDIIRLAQKATEAIKGVYGVPYTAGTAPELIYPFSGGSADWAKGVAKVKYSYLLEIRDDGRYGFLLPPEQIVPTGEEHWAGIRVIAEEILSKYKAIPAPELKQDDKENSVEKHAVTSTASSSRETSCMVALVTVCTLMIKAQTLR